MHEHQNPQSGVNTVLIVLLIIIILGAVFWYFGGFEALMDGNQSNNEDVNIEVNLPEGNGNNNGE